MADNRSESYEISTGTLGCTFNVEFTLDAKRSSSAVSVGIPTRAPRVGNFSYISEHVTDNMGKMYDFQVEFLEGRATAPLLPVR